jgi:hypothetical protein
MSVGMAMLVSFAPPDLVGNLMFPFETTDYVLRRIVIPVNLPFFLWLQLPLLGLA